MTRSTYNNKMKQFKIAKYIYFGSLVKLLLIYKKLKS